MRRTALLWAVGGLLAIGLSLLLAYFLLSRTAFGADAATRMPTAQTAVGGLECRKTLTLRFPFFALTCGEDR